jgi:hypothetical protein
MYIYIAILFSFSYYGIARVSGVPYSWPEGLLTSIFIPFFISDLPRIFPIRLLGGIHYTLVLVVGIGTIVNFLHGKMDALRESAAQLSDLFAQRNILEKYLILQEKFSAPTIPARPGVQP